MEKLRFFCLISLRVKKSGDSRRASGIALPFVDGDEMTGCLAGINLARPGNPQVVVMHLFPVGNPAGHPADGKHDGVHIEWDADGAQQEAAVEINVGIQISRYEIIVA